MKREPVSWQLEVKYVLTCLELSNFKEYSWNDGHRTETWLWDRNSREHKLPVIDFIFYPISFILRLLALWWRWSGRKRWLAVLFYLVVLLALERWGLCLEGPAVCGFIYFIKFSSFLGHANSPKYINRRNEYKYCEWLESSEESSNHLVHENWNTIRSSLSHKNEVMCITVSDFQFLIFQTMILCT